ncbi:glycosyltransferase family 4 protein [Synechococcus sp. A18-25c]|uniref:glycosyltransferase family 4 protein n=1 Tax=Synechococcus sp. A18-25c TaxID=1866938 RepID=UPI001648AC3A|nr:glycosyltransferase [Synechococcus sp. A18-25c]
MVEQLLREWPPGYGGVERVAHELASVWGGAVYSLDVQRQEAIGHDPLPVGYPRRRLPSTKPIARLQLPLPSRALWRLLRSQSPLHGHLPSPGVLLVLLLARLMRPQRRVTAHWHCFLEPDCTFSGCLFVLYQWLALRLVPQLSAVITTSPLLAQELQRCGCDSQRLFVLPCCLSQQQEQLGLALPVPEAHAGEPLRVLFIGRLDSYKRLDWLLAALAQLTSPWQLVVVGDGPKRPRFEQLAQRLFPQGSPVRFLGRLPETAKLDQLAAADLLVLPSDCSNEAFGIVQLEAMVAGRIALAFDQSRSGMGWVGQLPGLPWSQSPEGLADVLQHLAEQPALRQQLSVQARERYLSLFARGVWLQHLQGLGDSVVTSKVSA